MPIFGSRSFPPSTIALFVSAVLILEGCGSLASIAARRGLAAAKLPVEVQRYTPLALSLGRETAKNIRPTLPPPRKEVLSPAAQSAPPARVPVLPSAEEQSANRTAILEGIKRAEEEQREEYSAAPETALPLIRSSTFAAPNVYDASAAGR